jgi:hypothetical protein
VPEGIRAVLARLRTQPEDDARWIAFCLLELPLPALKALAHGLELVRHQPPNYGAFRRFVWPGDDVVICVVSSNGHSPEQLAANLEQRVAIERYRRRIRKAIGFGIATEDTNPFTVAVWGDMEWEANLALDQLVENDAPGILLPGTKVPSRNAPCLCGSGKKFKKCCLPKIERLV